MMTATKEAGHARQATESDGRSPMHADRVVMNRGRILASRRGRHGVVVTPTGMPQLVASSETIQPKLKKSSRRPRLVRTSRRGTVEQMRTMQRHLARYDPWLEGSVVIMASALNLGDNPNDGATRF
jgi:hypothetical protein